MTQQNPHGLFITGTDTGVGKTVIASGLTRLGRKHGVRALAVKPIETGCTLQDGVLFPEDGAVLREAAERELTLDECVALRFTLPSSAARAAAAEGRDIDMLEIQRHVCSIAERGDLLVVEGAGGLMVPIQGRSMMIDLIELLGYPVLLVARTRLGTINHTLLSVNALQNRGILIAGIVLSAASPHIGPEEAYTPGDLARLVDDIPVAVLPYVSAEQRNDPAAVAGIMETAIPAPLWRRWVGIESL